MRETDGAVITVSSQLGDDGQIELSVSDMGPGLPSGKADQIFDAFLTTAGAAQPSTSPFRPLLCKRALLDASMIRPFAEWVHIQQLSGTSHLLLRSVSAEFKVMQELMRDPSLRSAIDIYTQAVTPAKRSAQAAVLSLVFPACPHVKAQSRAKKALIRRTVAYSYPGEGL